MDVGRMLADIQVMWGAWSTDDHKIFNLRIPEPWWWLSGGGGGAYGGQLVIGGRSTTYQIWPSNRSSGQLCVELEWEEGWEIYEYDMWGPYQEEQNHLFTHLTNTNESGDEMAYNA
jgi:hypothetical protein